MAKLGVGGSTQELKDGDSIQQACEAAGIPFSCKEGVCGSCLIDVVEGENNLNELNEAEQAFGLEGKKKRLACQAKINSGEVKVKSGY